MALAYEVRGLTKVYSTPKPVLANDHIDLSVEEGEIVGIFGPNGAGKTTLVRQLVGLLRPTSGTIKLFGHDIVAKPSLATHYVAYFSQETYYFWHLKPQEVLVITGRLRGLSLKEARTQAEYLLKRFELDGLKIRPLARLSFGQARFVTLLSVFMGKRPVLVLDEPSNDLDPMHRRLFWDYLWEVNSKEGTTVLLVTHNVHEAEHVVHRVIIVDEGRIIASGSPTELKRRLAGQMRIEVELAEWNVDLASLVLPNCEMLPAKRNTLLLQVPRDEVDKVVQEIREKIPPEAINNLRIVPPSLEDVYVQVVKKEWK